MTIHRALSELKLIDSRIEKKIYELTPSGTMQKDKLVNDIILKDEFVLNANANYQSITDLIDRKHKIKSAIVYANSNTIVKIGNNEMTISDAINFKSLIKLKKGLIESIKSKHQSIVAKFVRENERINLTGLENAKIMIGKQGDDRVKPTDNDVKAIVDPFVKRNEYHLVDPLKVDILVKELQDEVEEFEVEVDAVLSEINAITLIEI